MERGCMYVGYVALIEDQVYVWWINWVMECVNENSQVYWPEQLVTIQEKIVIL